MAFWVKQIHGMVGALPQTVEDSGITPCLNACGGNGIGKQCIVNNLAAGECKQQSSRFYGLYAQLVQAFVAHHGLMFF